MTVRQTNPDRYTINQHDGVFDIQDDGELIATFYDGHRAVDYKVRNQRFENISCCPASASSNGWRHVESCHNHVMCY
jgi:hypothetical protein